MTLDSRVKALAAGLGDTLRLISSAQVGREVLGHVQGVPLFHVVEILTEHWSRQSENRFCDSSLDSGLTVCVTVISSLHFVLPKTRFSIKVCPLPNSL